MTEAAVLRRDRRAWIAAGLGAAVLCLLFRPEIAAAIVVWNSSTAYGHCWLVLPIALWLIWDRREAAAAHPARPSPWSALAALPLLLLWAASDLLGIMEGRQIAAILVLLVLLLAALGPSLWWALSAGFLYLLFLVPFGAFLTPSLQHFTARFITVGLRVLNIPFEADTFQITIPEGVFYVAEACAGLRFLIASIAFGVLYAVTMFRSPWRRAAFIAVACVVPVVANGVRGLGIVLLGHALGSAEAGAADHLIYGWVFFSAVIVLLALSGLPFRQAPAAQHTAEVPPRGEPPRWGMLAVACVPVLLLAAAGPVLAARGGAATAERAFTPPAALAGCSAATRKVTAGRAAASYTCGVQSVRVTSTALPRAAGPARILDAARQPAFADLGGDIDTELWVAPGSAAAPWMLARARDTGRQAAYAVRVGGRQGVGSLGDRVHMLRAMLGGAGQPPPMAIAVQMAPGEPEGDRTLTAVLAQLSAGWALEER